MARPAALRSKRRLRSNSLRTARTPTTIFPVAVLVSMLWGDELCPFALDLLDDLKEVKLRARKAIQAIHDNSVALAQQIEDATEFRPIPLRPGGGLSVEVAVFHPGVGQRLQLKRPILRRG